MLISRTVTRMTAISKMNPVCVNDHYILAAVQQARTRRACRLSFSVVNRRDPEGSNADDMSGLALHGKMRCRLNIFPFRLHRLLSYHLQVVLSLVANRWWYPSCYQRDAWWAGNARALNGLCFIGLSAFLKQILVPVWKRRVCVVMRLGKPSFGKNYLKPTYLAG